MTYTDTSKERSVRVQLLRCLRFETLVADWLTGVADRKEWPSYDASIIKSWLEDSPNYVAPAIQELIGDWRKVELKVATYNWRARKPSDAPRDWETDEPIANRKFLIEGSPDEVVRDIERVRGWPSGNFICDMQYLRYKDGRIKITVGDGSTVGY